MARKGRVVILNGVGSVGKGSTARALQAIARDPWLHLQMDSFLEMLPPGLWGHADGIVFRPGAAGTAIETGPVAVRLLDGLRRAVAALAAAGNDLIVDEVMEAPEATDYRRLLAGHELHLVGLHAPLAVLEARERARGDREPGLARWQFDRLHRGIAYDLELDTGQATPEEVARQIAARFEL